MKTKQVKNESVNNVVTNDTAAEQIFAQEVNSAKEKATKKPSANVPEENTANSLETSKTLQRSWLIYAEREFATEIKAVANEHFARIILGGETLTAAKWSILRLVGAKLMQDGASKGRKMFKATLRKIAKDMQETGVYSLPTADLISKTRQSMKEEAKAIKLEAERKAKAEQIAKVAAKYGIPVAVAEQMLKDGIKIA